MKIAVFWVCIFIFFSCKNDQSGSVAIKQIPDLKRGEIISCSPREGALYGSVLFTVSIPDTLKNNFNTAVALLHSFEYDEAEKMFAKVIDAFPGCTMAYWGVAMSNFHPLWAPPSAEELQKGMEAIEIARSLKNKSKRESDYIEAIAAFFQDAESLDHRTRLLKFEKAMEKIYTNYKDDLEASIFYALALNAAADPKDKTYSNQKKAFKLLEPIFEKHPMHPGLAHYIIHNMDYPGLAVLALPAARKYAGIAPASAHAQHMPSHIFTRLGLWDECIQSNLVSVASAQCYAEQAGIKGHWDEELHALDYLVYAYLQKKSYDSAKLQLNYLQTIKEIHPANFKVAYALAAIPARYALERKDWKMAATLSLPVANLEWKDFPWQEAVIHFTRILGQVHLEKITEAEKELTQLKSLYQILGTQKNKTMETAQLEVQIKTATAWIELGKGNMQKAKKLMMEAADQEDATEKHPVTPGSVLPARELLGDMLLQMKEPTLAMEAFEKDLKINPNRANGMEGLAVAKKMK